MCLILDTEVQGRAACSQKEKLCSQSLKTWDLTDMRSLAYYKPLSPFLRFRSDGDS